MRVKRIGYLGLRTDDVAGMTMREARAAVQAAGLELVGEPVWAAEAFGDPTLGEFAWFFVCAPDGRVFAIEQVPD